MERTIFIINCLQLIPQSVLWGLGIVVAITMIYKNYDNITHKCGKVLRFIFSIALMCHVIISMIMAFICTSTGHMAADDSVAVSNHMTKQFNYRILPCLTSIIYNYNEIIVGRLLYLIKEHIRIFKERILVREICYNRTEQDAVYTFVKPCTALLQ